MNEYLNRYIKAAQLGAFVVAISVYNEAKAALPESEFESFCEGIEEHHQGYCAQTEG